MIVENIINGTHYIHIRCDKCGGIASTYNRGGEKKYKVFRTREDAVKNAKKNGWVFKSGKTLCKLCAKELL